MKTIDPDTRSKLLLGGSLLIGAGLCYILTGTAFAGVAFIAPVLLAALIDVVL